ncbi:MAG: ribose-phosphate pyrophosphokinase [Deltaproteobacteria bacterium]|nr:ribose-phosphate pyrophosphokinase [Deltaproteobacteria bacterium]MBI2231523.1 ribose-phosphate pyrophosphokinase [Deltaproteobacteria bacterium]
MSLEILSGSANSALAENIAKNLGVRFDQRTLERFPDGELHIEIHESIRGCDVYLIQPTCPPVDEHFFELFLLADACRRAGATHLTAVIPYFGYARQDRRAHGREPVSTRLVADLIAASCIERVIVVDFHSHAVESAFAIPVEHVSAIPILADAIRPSVHKDAVVVSPDLGAVKMAERYAKLLDLSVAIIHKSRISGAEVTVQRIVGDVRDREIVVVDDMITTGATIEKAILALLEAGCSSSGIKVVASHGLFVGNAVDRLTRLPIEKIYVSDSVPAPERFPLPIQVSSLTALLAETIQRLHRLESLGDVLAHE